MFRGRPDAPRLNLLFIAALLLAAQCGSPALAAAYATLPPDEHRSIVGLCTAGARDIASGLSVEACSESRSQSNPWRRAPYVAAGTLLLYPQDLEIQRWIQERRSPATDRAAAFAKQFGEPETYMRPLAVLYLYGELFEDARARRTAGYTAEGLILCGLTTQPIKYAVRRPRPGDSLGEDPFEKERSRLSFPSGHTAVAFTVATVLSAQYGSESAVTLLAYALAAMTGWSRMNDNDHWASDILFGSYIGYISAREAMRMPDDRPRTDTPAAKCPVSLSFSF